MTYFDIVSLKIKKLEYSFQKTLINYNSTDSLRERRILNEVNRKANDTKAEFVLTGLIPGSSNRNKCTPLKQEKKIL